MAKLDFKHLDQNVFKGMKRPSCIFSKSVHGWQSKNVITVSRVLAQLTLNEMHKPDHHFVVVCARINGNI